MEAWMAFISIMAIVAIVVVGGGIIAFIGHMIIGAFDNNKQSRPTNSKDVIDYAQYKQLEDAKQVNVNNEYDFKAINQAKAKEEKSLLDAKEDEIFNLDEEIEEISNLEEETEVEEEVKPEVKDDIFDDLDIDDMLSEISNDIIEEEKAIADEVNKEEVKIGDELNSYTIDEMLKEVESFDEETENAEEPIEETVVAEEVEDTVEETEEAENIVEEIEAVEKDEVVEEVKEEQPVVETVVKDEAKDKEIEDLKAQLAELNKQLEAARSGKVEVVSIDMTEEECVARLETLEERLKNVKKDYKINAKEYRPLKKVMNDLERYQTKLRRKEAVVAKKKVVLYGVNNYVDIDKEKAEKLANELELLDGLRLSVSHCEEVINANKDRFPILEHTNQILEDQIAHIEADIASTQATLQKLRDKNGNDEENNEGNEE